MLRTIRKYKTSVLGVVAIGLIALAMSGFGVNLINPSQEGYAIKIDDHLISFSDFHNERQELEQRYRQMFGSNFDELAKSFGINLNEQTKEKLISDFLLQRFARELGFYASDSAVRQIIQKELFPQGFDASTYAYFLSQQGLTPAQFEEKLRRRAAQLQLAQFIEDVSIASLQEAEISATLDGTKYTVQYVEFHPSDFVKEVPAPSDEVVQSYYDEHTTDFEAAAEVAYDYTVLDPSQHLHLVEISPDDIEIYYSDHLSDFATPEEFHIRRIQFSFPAGADNAKRDAVRKEAEEILKRVKAGEAFAELAKLHSDEVGAAATAGDMGWISKGQLSKALESAAFKLLPGETTDLVESGDSLYILKVEEVKPSQQKDLADVKPQIEQAIREREAPAWTANYAQELFDEFTRGNLSLKEFAAGRSLKVESSAGSLKKGLDPAGLEGLTDKVLDMPGDRKQLTDIGEKSVLVEVTNYREAAVQPLSAVKDEVVTLLKRREAQKLARQKAQQVVDELQAGRFQSLKGAADASKRKLEELKDVTRTGAAGPLSRPEIRTAVFSTFKAMEKPTRVFESGENLYVFQVTAITPPKAEEVESKLDSRLQQENRTLAETVLRSLLNRLKAQAQIDVDPWVLGEQ